MQKGFTIVELIVVIVVVGIIASIAVISYNGAQSRAHDVSVQSDLESIAGELEAYRVRTNTSNPQQRFPVNTTELGTLEIQAAKSSYDLTTPVNLVYCVGPSGSSIDANQTFKLIAESKSGNIFVMTHDGFVPHSYTTASMTTGLCSGSTPIQLNGWTIGGGWTTWVRSS